MKNKLKAIEKRMIFTMLISSVALIFTGAEGFVRTIMCYSSIGVTPFMIYFLFSAVTLGFGIALAIHAICIWYKKLRASKDGE